MRKVLVCAFALLVFLPLTASAQKVEVFGGYSYARLNADNTNFLGSSGVNLNGWNASLTANVVGPLGLVADFSGHYGSPTVATTIFNGSRVHSYLFGPQLKLRLHRIEPFARALFGGIHASTNPNNTGRVSDNGFGAAIGGGIDVKVSNHFALRLIQADYVLSRFDSSGTGSASTQNNFRYSAGFVIRLGN